MRQAGGLTAEDIDRGFGQPLEQLGVSLTFGECLACLEGVFLCSLCAQSIRLKLVSCWL
jgi:hypothetical protein